MNVGLLLTGISYGVKSRDFRHCAEGFFTQIIDPLRAQRHTVVCFATTYEHPFLDELKSTFQPVAYAILPFEGSSQLTTRLRCVELTKGYDLDFYILCRFDLHFHAPITDWNLDFTKFNVVSREGNGYWDRARYTNDTLFAWAAAVHPEVLRAFHDAVTHADHSHMHYFYSFVHKYLHDDRIHFMSDAFQLSGHLLTNICADDYVRRLRAQIPSAVIHPDILARFSP